MSLTVTLIGKMLAHDGFNIQIMGRCCWTMKDLIHHLLPFFSVRFHFAKELKYNQMSYFMGNDLIKEDLRVFSEQNRIQSDFP